MEATVSVREGTTSAVSVKVVKIGSAAELIAVAFRTEQGTAEDGVDFVPLSGVFIFLATETEKEIVISLLDDSLLEGQEEFRIVLSLPLQDQMQLTLTIKELRVDIEDDDGMYISACSIPRTVV